MKHYLIGTVLSLLAGAILTGIFWFLQWISWWLIFILAVLILIPGISFCSRCWEDYHCCDFEDLIWAIKQNFKSKNEPENNNRIM